MQMTRSITSALAALSAVLLLCFLSSIDTGLRLLAGDLLIMGGNSNPDGLTMDQELHGYISTAPGTHYAGYDSQIVRWPAQTPFTSGSTGELFDTSQAEGVSAINSAVGRTYRNGHDLVVVGYSSSANVATREIRALANEREQGQGAPSVSDLSFVLIGNPNRPNGGIFERFVGLYLGPLGMSFDGATPATDYQVTDISWEYDPVSDFPTYPLNVVADLNAAVGFFTLHSSYFGADPTDQDSVIQDVTVGNTRYVTVRPEHIPLLQPLYNIGVAAPLLDAVEPALKVIIDAGYDRSISPGTPTPAKLLPLTGNITALPHQFLAALEEGIQTAVKEVSGAPGGTSQTPPNDTSRDSTSAPGGITTAGHASRVDTPSVNGTAHRVPGGHRWHREFGSTTSAANNAAPPDKTAGSASVLRVGTTPPQRHRSPHAASTTASPRSHLSARSATRKAHKDPSRHRSAR